MLSKVLKTGFGDTDQVAATPPSCIERGQVQQSLKKARKIGLGFAPQFEADYAIPRMRGTSTVFPEIVTIDRDECAEGVLMKQSRDPGVVKTTAEGEFGHADDGARIKI